MYRLYQPQEFHESTGESESGDAMATQVQWLSKFPYASKLRRQELYSIYKKHFSPAAESKTPLVVAGPIYNHMGLPLSVLNDSR